MLKSVQDFIESTLILYKKGWKRVEFWLSFQQICDEEGMIIKYEKFIIMATSNVYGTILDI